MLRNDPCLIDRLGGEVRIVREFKSLAAKDRIERKKNWGAASLRGDLSCGGCWAGRRGLMGGASLPLGIFNHRLRGCGSQKTGVRSQDSEHGIAEI